ncbi:DUF3108 domain-containing protein [Sulfurospirillum sp. 1612]|uniref:DUF3108 domain-containing protein n=1 Tax=Sulfurospirillum sp. 1612 TaxID=3094835 RepID=UPI002F945794
MKYLWLLLLCFNLAFAKDITATYKVSFGIFGQIGTAKTSLHIEKNHYQIKVHAKSTGFASFVSGGREEFYESEGVVQGTRLIPNHYSKIVKNKMNIGDPFEHTNKIVMKIYTLLFSFDHDKKSVMIKKIREKGAQKSQEEERAKFYTDNDILSLFFNFKHLFPDLNITKHTILHAIGANKDNGKIDILPLSKKEFQNLVSGDMSHLYFMKVILDDKIFSSKKGELYIALDKEGICEKAVLKDVVFFGDIRGELIEKSIK